MADFSRNIHVKSLIIKRKHIPSQPILNHSAAYLAEFISINDYSFF